MEFSSRFPQKIIPSDFHQASGVPNSCVSGGFRQAASVEEIAGEFTDSIALGSGYRFGCFMGGFLSENWPGRARVDRPGIDVVFGAGTRWRRSVSTRVRRGPGSLPHILVLASFYSFSRRSGGGMAFIERVSGALSSGLGLAWLEAFPEKVSASCPGRKCEGFNGTNPGQTSTILFSAGSPFAELGATAAMDSFLRAGVGGHRDGSWPVLDRFSVEFSGRVAI